MGSQRSGYWPPKLAKVDEVTPRTVTTFLFKWMILPTMAGSAPKRRCQNPKLSTTPGVALVAWSRAGSNNRPQAANDPNSVK
jgi:hypothetical protein